MSGVSRASVALSGAATGIVVAHVLGPAGLGRYAVAQTLIALLVVFTTLGIEHGIVYYVSSGRWDPVVAFTSSQWLALKCGLAGIAAALLLRMLVPSACRGLSIPVTLIAAGALPFALSWYYASYVHLATSGYERYVIPPAVQSALALCLVSGLGTLYGIGGAVLGLTLAHVITAIHTFAIARGYFSGRDHAPREGTHATRLAISFGIKGYAANSMQAVNLRLDMFILNAVAAGAVVGHYAVAVAITGVMWMLPLAVSDILFPRVAALSAGSGKAHADLLRQAEVKSLRHVTLATILTAVLISLALVVLVVPVYGSAFSQSTGLGFILLPGVALVAISNPLAAVVVGRGRPGLLLSGIIVLTPVTLTIYVLLIPQLHATGAALSSSISYAANFGLLALFYRIVTGENPLRDMLPTTAEFADYRRLAHRLGSRAARPI